MPHLGNQIQRKQTHFVNKSMRSLLIVQLEFSAMSYMYIQCLLDSTVSILTEANERDTVKSGFEN